MVAAKSFTLGDARKERDAVVEELLEGLDRVQHLLRGEEARFVRDTLERREEATQDGVEMRITEAQILWLGRIRGKLE